MVERAAAAARLVGLAVGASVLALADTEEARVVRPAKEARVRAMVAAEAGVKVAAVARMLPGVAAGKRKAVKPAVRETGVPRSSLPRRRRRGRAAHNREGGAE